MMDFDLTSVPECLPPEEGEEHLPTFPDSAGAQPDVRGERLLRWFDALFLRLDRAVERLLPAELNPLAQTGAIANTCFLVALVTGGLLLFWYSASVRQAYESVAAMGQAPFTAGLVRSLHRYSSDACMFFVAVHAFKLFFARRFSGARWLAWVTGLVAVGLLWLVGWLGYWLVWDERARQVALGTARLIDVLPIFVDPLSRSFLTDATINSLLFFVVFFMHMLVPPAMGIALWLHIARLSRPRFLTRGPMTLWVVGALIAVSLLFPAANAGPARMAVTPRGFGMDAWFLLPLGLTDRLGAGALWGLLLVAGPFLLAVPWWMAKGRAVTATVDTSRCNACTQCYHDCPYNAIQMMPRTDGRRFATWAVVDPSVCVGCGICAGSCNTGAIGLPWLPVVDQRRRIDQWLESVLDGAPPLLAFLCADSAGGTIQIDPATGLSASLPGYRCIAVPCAGWIHALTVERALRRGARGVLIAACPASSCQYREGVGWAKARLSGQRDPALRPERIDPTKLRLLELDRADGARLIREAAAFREGSEARQTRYGRGRWVGAAALVAALGGVVYAGSAVPYAPPALVSPELVVSFKHPGRTEEACHELSAEEQAKLPVHMRTGKVCERKRAPVRLRVTLDGREILNRAWPPTGLWGDGISVGIERLEVAPGRHQVAVAIGDSMDPGEWSFTAEKPLEFTPQARHTVLFDRLEGFTWE